MTSPTTHVATAVWFKIQVFAVTAIVFSAAITAIFLTMAGAAWFAWGFDAPRIPWFLWRFFLFIGWALSAVVAICVSDSDGSGEAVETKGSTEGDSAGRKASPEDQP